ncbi:MAG: exo-alpha-sialidase [Pirellulaceae bacterium]
MQRSNVFRLVTCQAIALGLALLAGGLVLQAADPEAVPLQAAPGLFNTTDTDTLGLQKVPGQHRMIYRASETGYKFCHHPQLVVFQDRCYAMWSNGILAEDTPGQRILYCSTSDGTNWTKPRVLTDHDAGKGICVAAGFRVHEKQLIAYYTVTGGTNFHPATALYARLSSDGKQWSPARRITSGFFINPPLQLANGHLVIGGEHVGEQRATARMRMLVTRSPAGLSGWRQAKIAVNDLKVIGYAEPNMYQRQDGTVVMPLRNYSGYFYVATSRDQGQSWSTPVKTNFPDSTARFALGKFPDQTVYLINNPGPKQFDRHLLAISTSTDGRTFKRSWIIRSEPTKMRYPGKNKLDGWQYPHAIVWKSFLYVAYSINKEDVAVTRIPLKHFK